MELGATILGFLLACFGCFCGWYGWRQHLLAQASAGWPHTSGTILATRLKKALHDDESRIRYEGIVTYEYAVGGEMYTSSTLAIGRDKLELTELQALKLADLYPLQQAVQVYYNPEDPSQAVLEAGESGQSVLLMVVGCALLAAGGWLLLAT